MVLIMHAYANNKLQQLHCHLSVVCVQNRRVKKKKTTKIGK